LQQRGEEKVKHKARLKEVARRLRDDYTSQLQALQQEQAENALMLADETAAAAAAAAAETQQRAEAAEAR